MDLITKEIKFSNPYTVTNAVKSLSIIFNKNGRQFVPKSARILFFQLQMHSILINKLYFSCHIIHVPLSKTMIFFLTFQKKAFIDSLNEKHIQVFSLSPKNISSRNNNFLSIDLYKVVYLGKPYCVKFLLRLVI